MVYTGLISGETVYSYILGQFYRRFGLPKPAIFGGALSTVQATDYLVVNVPKNMAVHGIIRTSTLNQVKYLHFDIKY